MATRDDTRKPGQPGGAGQSGNSQGPTRYKHKDMDNRRKAKSLLAKLMPEAERRAPEFTNLETKSSSLGANTFKHIHIDRVTGVHVYQGERGGWYYDLSFKDLPPGVPNVLGQPVAFPLETREEAIDGAVSMLAMLVNKKDQAPPPQDDAEAVFPFDDVDITLPSEMIRTLSEAGVPLPDHEYVRTRLDEVRKEFAGDGPLTGDILEKLSRDDLMRVYAVAAMAICRGIPRWPQFEEGVPRSKQH